jgi:hypothetical protein
MWVSIIGIKVGHNVAVFRCKRVFGLGMVWNGLALSIIFGVGLDLFHVWLEG